MEQRRKLFHPRVFPGTPTALSSYSCQLFVLLLFSAIFRFLKCEGRAAHLISSGLTFQACDENNLLSFESLKEISEIDEMLSSEDRRTGKIFFVASGAASPGSCS